MVAFRKPTARCLQWSFQSALKKGLNLLDFRLLVTEENGMGFRRLLLAAGVACGILSISAPAHATTYFQQWDDWGYVSDNGTTTSIKVCDVAKDGHGVYIQYTPFGLPDAPKVWDANGSAPGCSTYSGLGHISSARLCVNGVVCTPWVAEPPGGW
ncbi:hypothetical protein [Planotetraspora sp. GP83]|uniref:hypothetical protein n=1 Tax=Planotetraspora sp. GP83 TaxID=3156264 RepID=UPI0035179B8D